MDRKKLFSLLLGLVVSLLFAHLLLRGVPWKDVGATFLTIHWIWCIPAVIAYIFGHFLRGIRCSWIMRPYKSISFLDATQIVWIGYAANNLLPARLGEVVRAYVMSKREDIPQGIALSTLFVERLLDGLSIMAILWTVSLFAPSYPWIQQITWISGAIFLGALSVMLIARFWRHRFEQLLAWGTGFFPQSIAEKLQGFGVKLLEGLECLRFDRYLLGILTTSLFVWVFEGAMFLLVLPAFGLKVSLVTAYLAMAITNLGVLLPSTPGHVITFHFFCSNALMATGAITVRAVGIGYATIVHALQFVPVTILGVISLYTYGLNLRSVWAMGNEKKPPTENEPSLPEATSTV